ncbi:hypothetical protein ACJVDH_05735 [Pedobacter sp. AW1-32]|uniref:hypothetical protein n=1 Tax=Pedobacter sp. AW1-32 TaxID=3383026 RepID=UPI003FF0629E
MRSQFATKIVQFTVVLIFSTYLTYAQNERILPNTPEASGLAKYINFPVDYSTGVPNISIPIYELKVGELTLPLVLNYHAGGIKVNEEATWVGLGWQLSGLPQISRTVNGNNDFANTGYLQNANKGNNSLDYLHNWSQGFFDEDPDEFYYSLLAKSGKFYMRSLNDVLTIPYDPISVSGSSSLFTVTDDDQTQYRFGKSLDNISASESITYSVLRSAVIAWKCTEIISPSKRDTLKFQYHEPISKITELVDERIEVFDNSNTGEGAVKFEQRDSYAPDYGYVYPRVYMYNISNDYSGLYLAKQYGIEKEPDNIYNQQTKESIISNSIAQMLYVKQITGRNVRVNFYIHNNNQKQLDSIVVRDLSGQKIKHIQFTYGDFGSEVSPYNLKQLRLDAVGVKGNTGTALEKYSFEYKSNNVVSTSRRADPWGYYGRGALTFNYSSSGFFSAITMQDIDVIQGPYWHAVGRSSFLTADYDYTPSQTWRVSIGGVQVSPEWSVYDEENVQTAILKKITYPSGGATTFNYEVNRYKDLNTGIAKIASGLRVKEIQYYTNTEIPTPAFRKIYKYGDDENGFGLVKSVNDTSSTFMYEQPSITILGNTNIPFGYEFTERKRTFTPKPMDEMTFTSGTPVLYSTVTEYQEEGGMQTGKTVYTYDYNSTIFLPTRIDLTQISLPVDNEWDSGILTSKTVYAYKNGFQWIEKDEYEYERYKHPLGIFIGKLFTQNLVNILDPSIDATLAMKNYAGYARLSKTLYTGRALLSKERHFSRDLNNLNITVSTEQNNTYNNPAKQLQPDKISKTDSKGNISSTIIGYNEYLNPKEVVNLIEAGSVKVTGGTYNVYRADGLISTQNNLEIVEPIEWDAFSSTLYSPFKLDDRYKQRATYDLYDARGNVLQITDKKSIKISYIWSYNNTYPIAEIKNTDYATVESVLGGSAAVLNLSNSVPTDTQIMSIGNTLRSAPALKNAQITTYTYKPLVGMTSQTDPKGMTTYYEYDDFGRLKWIKDQDGNIVKENQYHYKN